MTVDVECKMRSKGTYLFTLKYSKNLSSLTLQIKIKRRGCKAGIIFSVCVWKAGGAMFRAPLKIISLIFPALMRAAWRYQEMNHTPSRPGCEHQLISRTTSYQGASTAEAPDSQSSLKKRLWDSRVWANTRRPTRIHTPKETAESEWVSECISGASVKE